MSLGILSRRLKRTLLVAFMFKSRVDFYLFRMNERSTSAVDTVARSTSDSSNIIICTAR